MKQICQILWCPLIGVHPNVSNRQTCENYGCWLFVLFIAAQAIFQLSGGCHHCRWQGCKFRPMLGTQGLWAGRDLYCVTPTATRDLGLYRLIQKTGTHIPKWDSNPRHKDHKIFASEALTTAPRELIDKTSSMYLNVWLKDTASFFFFCFLFLLFSLQIKWNCRNSRFKQRRCCYKVCRLEPRYNPYFILFIKDRTWIWNMNMKNSIVKELASAFPSSLSLMLSRLVIYHKSWKHNKL
jgi:hypothetical protein